MTQLRHREILKHFHVDAGDEVLKKHLEVASKRKLCISQTSQKDEVTDVNNWEQLGIVLHYIKDGHAIVRLVGFVALEQVRCFPGHQVFSCSVRG